MVIIFYMKHEKHHQIERCKKTKQSTAFQTVSDVKNKQSSEIPAHIKKTRSRNTTNLDKKKIHPIVKKPAFTLLKIYIKHGKPH